MHGYLWPGWDGRLPEQSLPPLQSSAAPISSHLQQQLEQLLRLRKDAVPQAVSLETRLRDHCCFSLCMMSTQVLRVHLKGKSRIHSLTIVGFFFNQKWGKMHFQLQPLHLTQMESEPPHNQERSKAMARMKLYQLPVVICFYSLASFVLCQMLGHILLLPGKDAAIRIISC